MTESDLERIEEIYHAALELPEERRDEFISGECAGDQDLEAEVRSIIAAYERSPDFLATPAIAINFAEILDEELTNDLSGTTIGTYKVEKRLGGGGMGDVYLAHDEKLNRSVALKFLTSAFVDNQWANKQLKHEASAVAKLDHNNICTVYDFEEIGEHRFIVMQYIRGVSLSERLREGAIEPEKARHIGIQIVEAIVEAHRKGIIHRDLKPGNIMLQPGGEVKVLDFGLAKFTDSSGAVANHSQATGRFAVLGTPAYMSPEQARKETLDVRTDIFSLGTLLFELFTGVSPFARKTDLETAAAVIDPNTDLDALPWKGVPTELRPVIGKCLQKDKQMRYQSAADLLLDLRHPPRTPRRSMSMAAIRYLIIFLLFAASLSALYYFRTQKVYGVAVMPFANETGNAGLDYLADGIAESLTDKLGRSGEFRIVPYSKLAGVSANTTEPNSVARRVEADLVLTGRLFMDDGKVNVQTRLVDAEGAEVRSASNALDLADIASVEKGILDRMFSDLSIRPEDVAGKPSDNPGETSNPEAFRQYLIGRHFWKKRDKENIEKSIKAFQQAIDLDPGYSRAYAGLAESYVLQSSVAYGSATPKDSFTRARAAAKQAIDIDPRNAEAHVALGVVLTKHDWNWPEAEREYRQAIAIDPEYAAAHYWLSGLLGITGRSDESIQTAERAKDLDPFSPLVEYNLSRSYYFARQFEKSFEVLNRLSDAEKNDTRFLYQSGLILFQMGRNDEALKAFQEVSARNKMLAAAAMGQTLAKMGRNREVRQIIADLERIDETEYVPPQEYAIIYIGLNDRDKAFHYLNEAYKERYGSLSAIKVEPLFDNIRDDPRFTALLQQMALA